MSSTPTSPRLDRAARIAVTGIGAVTAVGHDVPALTAALRRGDCGVTTLEPDEFPGLDAPRLGAPVRAFSVNDALARLAAIDGAAPSRARRLLRDAPRSAWFALSAATEALRGAGLGGGDEQRALIVAGSNLNQALMLAATRQFMHEPAYVRPRYGVEFLDTHLVGILSEVLQSRGPGWTVGGASASSGVAVATACDLLRSERAPACLVVAPTPELSALEWHSLAVIGARCTLSAAAAGPCRPFDRGAAGFVPGEGGAALVLEPLARAHARGAPILAEIAAAEALLAGDHLPSPSVGAEARVMAQALRAAGIGPEAVDCVSAHATSTPIGDVAECEAIRRVLAEARGGVYINATKGLLGHTLTAAGALQIIAAVVQVRGGFVHPNLSLGDPVADDLRFVGRAAVDTPVGCVLSNSFGFGGINTSVVVRAWRAAPY